ncbi:hypothetical protein [Silvimonas sp.]|uniref:hypothetical protein n=1 Tax=Silvimonas sp. TaxID=2650811 RepID=UPI00283C798B|nr:hypothetical protein [Silvimonas sp.]MDR3428778.1 hypothetical protein [Silvimonas sp.]
MALVLVVVVAAVVLVEVALVVTVIDRGCVSGINAVILLTLSQCGGIRMGRCCRRCGCISGVRPAVMIGAVGSYGVRLCCCCGDGS